jgi:SAM-dependent methyltransferase
MVSEMSGGQRDADVRLHERWSEVSSVYAELVREYHARLGHDPSSPEVESTVRTNTELVPRRAENLLGALAAVGRPGFEGRRVLEVGCGFGALAAYLASDCGAESVVAVDVRPEFVEAAASAARAIGVDDRLSAQHGDMRDLGALAEDPFDVVLANNSFIYLPTAADMTSALAQFRRVLRPGGDVVFHHANPWQWREPFSRDPLVHLLPRPVADRVSGLTGWQHNHGRVRLVSAPRLAWMLRRAGFSRPAVVGIGRARRRRGARRFFANFYVVVARRSP